MSEKLSHPSTLLVDTKLTSAKLIEVYLGIHQLFIIVIAAEVEDFLVLSQPDSTNL